MFFVLLKNLVLKRCHLQYNCKPQGYHTHMFDSGSLLAVALDGQSLHSPTKTYSFNHEIAIPFIFFNFYCSPFLSTSKSHCEIVFTIFSAPFFYVYQFLLNLRPKVVLFIDIYLCFGLVFAVHFILSLLICNRVREYSRFYLSVWYLVAYAVWALQKKISLQFAYLICVSLFFYGIKGCNKRTQSFNGVNV